MKSEMRIRKKLDKVERQLAETKVEDVVERNRLRGMAYAFRWVLCNAG